ncbi:hypothetical protein PR003_g31023 [Phytophthora rubi]|uniref:Uncharacterized protein n=1 Tax=Phytophthora rubi TaxID=129364 RepID=A0A6A4BAU4_9STRA|nr:hypothetical protein PR003_g31023 [Phytophthora rubi]
MVAERQLAARRNAEAEQQRLWSTIDARAALIQEFKAMVNERVNGLEDFVSIKGRVFEGSSDDAFHRHKRVRQEPSEKQFSLRTSESWTQFTLGPMRFYAEG